jgi:hypothetical protein
MLLFEANSTSVSTPSVAATTLAITLMDYWQELLSLFQQNEFNDTMRAAVAHSIRYADISSHLQAFQQQLKSLSAETVCSLNGLDKKLIEVIWKVLILAFELVQV